MHPYWNEELLLQLRLKEFPLLVSSSLVEPKLPTLVGLLHDDDYYCCWSLRVWHSVLLMPIIPNLVKLVDSFYYLRTMTDKNQQQPVMIQKNTRESLHPFVV